MPRMYLHRVDDGSRRGSVRLTHFVDPTSLASFLFVVGIAISAEKFCHRVPTFERSDLCIRMDRIGTTQEMVGGQWHLPMIDGDRQSEQAASFDDLYRREYTAMVRLAYALVGRRDVAEEIVQDAFLEAHRRWNRLSTYDRPGAWIRRVVLQSCSRRRHRVRRDETLIGRIGRQPNVAAAQYDPPDPELLNAIRSLPKRQAHVLALIAVDDCSFADAAKILGCSDETARTHMRRARATLRSILETSEGARHA